MQEQTYGDDRARNLEAMLRALAEMIRETDAKGELLRNVPQLLRLIGDVKSELFHYEVRATYDTPEIAEHRRLVSDAERAPEWEKSDWNPDDEEEPEW